MLLKRLLTRLLDNDDGAEVAEWVVVVALLVLVGIVVYTQILQPELTSLVGDIGAQLDGLLT